MTTAMFMIMVIATLITKMTMVMTKSRRWKRIWGGGGTVIITITMKTM